MCQHTVYNMPCLNEYPDREYSPIYIRMGRSQRKVQYTEILINHEENL